MAGQKKGLPLTFQIIIALFAGLVVAIIAINAHVSWVLVEYIKPLGDIFIRILTFIALPLVLFSMIKGISSLSGASKLGRLATKTIGFYLGTTLLAVAIGLGMVNLIQPGKFVNEEQRVKYRVDYEDWTQKTDGAEIVDHWTIFEHDTYKTEALKYQQEKGAKTSQEETPAEDEAFKDLQKKASDQKDKGPLGFIKDMVPENIFQALGNNKLMLQVIVFAIFFGIALLNVPDNKGAPVIKLIDSANEVFLTMINMVMKAAPFFVFALMAGSISESVSKSSDSSTVTEILKGMLAYGLTVVAGLVVLAFVIYPLLIALFAKMSPKKFLKGISKAQSMAFSTSSSAATLPVTMEVTEKKLGASKSVANFVLPIGATVNMDGTSLYQAVAVIFLAQLHMVDLGLTEQLMIMVTATLASIGSAAVPSAGLVMLIIVLEAVGLNPAWIMVIYPIDRLLDMCRTVVNVTGDTAITAIVAKSEGQLNSETKAE